MTTLSSLYIYVLIIKKKNPHQDKGIKAQIHVKNTFTRQPFVEVKILLQERCSCRSENIFIACSSWGQFSSASSVQAMLGGGIQERGMASRVESQTIQTTLQADLSKKQLRWNDSMTDILVETLLDECAMGTAKKADNGWKNKALQKVVEEVKKKMGIIIDTSHVRSRIKTLKHQYFAVKDAISRSEFRFNAQTQLIEADSDAWALYLAKQPDAKDLRGKVIRNYEALGVIIGNEQATEDRVVLRAEVPETNETQDDILHMLEDAKGLASRTQSQGTLQADLGRKHLRWTDAMTDILVETLHEECEMGMAKKANNGWKSKALEKVVDEVKKQMGIINMDTSHVLSRIKTLKHQYFAVKDAVSQSGFSFNAASQTIEADPDAWTQYLAERPDARDLRGKVMQNYQSLVLMFGNDQATGDKASSGTDLPEANETTNGALHMLADVRGMASRVQSQNPQATLQTDFAKKPQLRWSDAMTDILIDILFEESAMGTAKKADNGWKNEALQKVVDEVKKEIGIINMDTNHVRSRIKTLKKQYFMARDAISQSDFSFNVATQKIEADPDAWARYLLVQPDAKELRGKVIRKYDALISIFGNDQTNGDKVVSGTDLPEVNELPNVDVSADNIEVNLNEDVANNEQYVEAHLAPNTSTTSQHSESSSTRMRKRSHGEDAMSSVVMKIADACERIARSYEAHIAPHASLRNVESVVRRITNLSHEDVIKIMDVFTEKPMLGLSFLELSESLREGWIRNKLRRYDAGKLGF